MNVENLIRVQQCLSDYAKESVLSKFQQSASAAIEATETLRRADQSFHSKTFRRFSGALHREGQTIAGYWSLLRFESEILTLSDPLSTEMGPDRITTLQWRTLAGKSSKYFDSRATLSVHTHWSSVPLIEPTRFSRYEARWRRWPSSVELVESRPSWLLSWRNCDPSQVRSSECDHFWTTKGHFKCVTTYARNSATVWTAKAAKSCPEDFKGICFLSREETLSATSTKWLRSSDSHAFGLDSGPTHVNRWTKACSRRIPRQI